MSRLFSVAALMLVLFSTAAQAQPVCELTVTANPETADIVAGAPPLDLTIAISAGPECGEFPMGPGPTLY